MKTRILYFLCMVTAFVVGIDFCLLARIYHSREIANPKFELVTTNNDNVTGQSQVFRTSGGATVFYFETTWYPYIMDAGPFTPDLSMSFRIIDLQKSGGRLLERTTLNNNKGEEIGVRAVLQCHGANGTFTKILLVDDKAFRTIDSDSRESALDFERTLRQ